MLTDMLNVQHLLRSRGILISFTGKLSQALIVEYGEAVKSYLETENRPKNEVFNIFSLFIEQTQNINNYCAVKTESSNYEEIAHSSIVTIGKTGSGSFVCSGNLIENANSEALQTYLDTIISLDKTGLKTLYKTVLKQEVPEGSRGAGLGLIDMARKASAPLEYSIVKQDEALSFFTLKAIV
ncbi:SiaB family protein kinase [Paenibacillus sepulcri]|uniref:SiaB family protein kinase n=1 Tax=Paenibacillus sepulcri TaxID=359917 RepID=A0ABS7C6V4_9BACL|nr:SiaB family protein kinase [Paenibacillus sepulcri]